MARGARYIPVCKLGFDLAATIPACYRDNAFQLLKNASVHQKQPLPRVAVSNFSVILIEFILFT